MRDPAFRPTLGRTANFKIFLLVIAFLFVLGMLLFSQQVIRQLLEKQREIVRLYARSIEYIASDRASSDDYSFVFEEVIQTIDFPIVLTDPDNVPIYSKNITYDTLMPPEERAEFFRELIQEMDRDNTPIRVALNDSIILNYVHYGESDLVRQLRWLPFVEISLAGLFIFIAYIGFSYIKRSEQGSIWVGMAKETAHQLGTPLSSIMGWLELLKERLGDPQKVGETLQELEHDVERLNKVADRFSKIGSRPDLKQEDLQEVIQGVIRYISRRLPRSGASVTIGVATPGPFIARINRELFEWVLENLLKNALDAMEGPGSITFALASSGRHVTIDVTDTGKGIDPKLHKDIFRPGYSTKKRGWGLGLSLSKRIIEDYHRGKLFVKQSAVGEGTTFRIRLRA